MQRRDGVLDPAVAHRAENGAGIINVAGRYLTLIFRHRCKSLLAVLLICAGGLCAARAASADPLPQPTGPVILAIRGAIANTNTTGEADFDLKMLEALPHATVTTTTVWTNGSQVFEGVSLRALMHLVGAQPKSLSARALNDYAIEIPAADFADPQVIVAYKQNGHYMDVADKGPLWIIYPDSIASPDIQSKMIWQLDAIVVGH